MMIKIMRMIMKKIIKMPMFNMMMMMIKIMRNIMMIKIEFMFRISKWFVPLEEYPYNRWPAYVTAGNIITVQTQ